MLCNFAGLRVAAGLALILEGARPGASVRIEHVLH